MSHDEEKPQNFLLPAVNCGNIYQAPAGLRQMAMDDGFVLTPAEFHSYLGLSSNGRYSYTSGTMVAQADIVVFVRTKDIHRNTVEDTYGMELSVLGTVRLLDDAPPAMADDGNDVVDSAMTMAMQGNTLDSMRIIFTYGVRCLTYLVNNSVVLVVEYNPEFINVPPMILSSLASDSDGLRWEECKKNLASVGYERDASMLAYTVALMLADINITQVNNAVALRGVMSMTQVEYVSVNGERTRYMTCTAEATSLLGTYTFHESTGADVFVALAFNADDATAAFRDAGVSFEAFNMQTVLNIDAVELQLGFLTRNEHDKFYMNCRCHTDPQREVDLSEMVHGAVDFALPQYLAIMAVTFIVGNATKVVRIPVRTCLV